MNKSTPIIEQFYKMADKYGDQTAVIEGRKSVTYKELKKKLDIISGYILNNYFHYINHHEILPIAVMFELNADYVACMFGILRINGICVPIDVRFSEYQIKNIFRNANIKLVIVNDQTSRLTEKICPRGAKIINVDDVFENKTPESLEKLKTKTFHNSLDDVAVLIHTSGSTGLPKGVIQTERNILYFADYFSKFISVTNKDKILSIAALSNWSIIRIFYTFLNGAAMVIMKLSEYGKGHEVISNNNVTIFPNWVVSFRDIMRSAPKNLIFSKVRFVEVGGETITMHEIELFKKHFSNECLFNPSYGCAEAPLFPRVLFQNKYLKNNKILNIPVGRIVNYKYIQVYLCKENGKHAQLGEEGEISIKSKYIYPGYWRPEYSKPEELKKILNRTNIYKTGDIGRYLSGNLFECIGRKDNQIKVRGHKIAKEDIEKSIKEFPGVINCGVVDCEVLGEKNFIVVCYESQTAINEENLDKFLSKKLPAYALPNEYKRILRIPTIGPRKIDRKALKELVSELNFSGSNDYRYGNSSGVLLSRKEIKQQLNGMWKEILGVDRIHYNDNFFNLGGHSLKAIKLIVMVNQKLMKNISINEIFRYPVFEDFVRIVEKIKKVKSNNIIKKARPARYLNL